MGPVRVLLVATHPVQYAAPLFRLYTADPRLDVTVAYCTLQGALPGVDPEFGISLAWDVPLLDGYRWVHPPNRSVVPGLDRLFGLINPGLWETIRRERFHIVVCYGYRAASFWIAALAAKVSDASLVLTTDAHTLAPRDGRRWKGVAKRLLLPLAFGLADAAFVPSTRSAAMLRGLGLPENKVFLTPYAVDTAFFQDRASRVDRAQVRRQWGIPEDTLVALFVGKLAPWKRPADLLEAVAYNDRLSAVFAGEGPMRLALESRAHALDLDKRVKFLGFINQTALPAAYAAADVLVLPSAYEPFGLVVNEAFACGLPAVVSEACGAAGDLVQEGKTGYIMPVGAVDALADRLSRLGADPVLRKALAAGAKRRIARWGPRQNVEAFVEACLALGSRRRRSSSA
jgi:glycosyltransferase involved in cell wall biosynthesis